MGVFGSVLLLFLAWNTKVTVIAAPLEERAGSVCSNGIYGELAPILAQYPIAQAFCTAFYPVPCTRLTKRKRAATTTSSTTKTSAGARIAATTTSSSSSTRRTSSTTTARTPTTTTARTSTTPTGRTSSTTSSQDAKASAWSQCQQQPGNVISTMCSCIEIPTACKTTTTTSTTSRSTTSSSITTTTSSSFPSTTISSTTTASSTTTSSTTTSSTTTSSITNTSSSTTTSSSSTTSSMLPSATCEASVNGGYTASDGAFYQVTCNFAYSGNSGIGGNFISYDVRGSLGACIDNCESTPSCVAINYNRVRQGDFEGQEAGACALLSSADPRRGSDFIGGDAATKVSSAPVPAPTRR